MAEASTFASRAAARNKKVAPAAVTAKTDPEVRGEDGDDLDGDEVDTKPAKPAAKKRTPRKK